MRSFASYASILALTLGACTAAPAPQPPPPAPAPAAADPYGELAALDSRKPVPLRPMMAWHQKQDMMSHLVVIEQITDALARQDWDGVVAAVAPLESSPQMAQTCAHMGAGAEGFTELALDLHRRADAIGVAARAHDGPGVLRATADTLASCTGCHAAYRQDVVDAPTYQARTGAAAGMDHGAGVHRPSTP